MGLRTGRGGRGRVASGRRRRRRVRRTLRMVILVTLLASMQTRRCASSQHTSILHTNPSSEQHDVRFPSPRPIASCLQGPSSPPTFLTGPAFTSVESNQRYELHRRRRIAATTYLHHRHEYRTYGFPPHTNPESQPPVRNVKYALSRLK